MLNYLGKMMKYEIRLSARTLLPLYAAFLILSLPMDISLAGTDAGGGILMGIITLAGFGVFIAAIVMTCMVILQRYNNTLYGDQAYLNMTLPVNTHVQLLTKVLNGILWNVVFLLFFLAAVGIMMLALGPILGSTAFVEGDYVEGEDILLSLGAGTIALMCVELLVGCIEMVMRAYTAISLGHLFPKAYKIVGILAFVVFSVVESGIKTFLEVVVAFDESLTLSDGAVIDLDTGMSGAAGIVFSLVFAVIYYAVTWYLVDRKLNLE